MMVADRDLVVTVDRLVAADVISIDEDDTVTFSSRFDDATGEYRTEFESYNAEDLMQAFTAVVDEEEANQLAGIGAGAPGFVATYRALVDFVEGLSHQERLQTVISLERLRDPLPGEDGVPDAFLPIRGDRIETLLQLSPKAILYAWKEDCPPCDLVAGDFDEIFEEPPEDLALLAVYGPNWARELHELFNIPGAPTTLFIEDGEVVVRLYGAHHTEVYESEVDNLRNGPSPVEVEPVQVPESDSET